MKTLIIFLTAISVMQYNLYAQNINGKLGTSGQFIIRDTTTTFLTLSQTNGNLTLLRNMELGNLNNSSSTVGVITKNGTRFMHNYQAPGTDGYNTFVGLNSGNFTMSGANSYNASYNTAVGSNTISSLTTGFYNSAFGTYS